MIFETCIGAGVGGSLNFVAINRKIGEFTGERWGIMFHTFNYFRVQLTIRHCLLIPATLATSDVVLAVQLGAEVFRLADSGQTVEMRAWNFIDTLQRLRRLD